MPALRLRTLFGLFSILLLGGSQAYAIPMTTDQENEVRFAFQVAADRARNCEFLAKKAPWLQKKMISSFESEIRIALKESEVREEDECAHSSPAWVTPSKRMVLRPIAFHPVCRGLAAVIFHEMVHMNWTFVAEPEHLGWGSEEQVQELERACIPEVATEQPARVAIGL